MSAKTGAYPTGLSALLVAACTAVWGAAAITPAATTIPTAATTKAPAALLFRRNDLRHFLLDLVDLLRRASDGQGPLNGTVHVLVDLHAGASARLQTLDGIPAPANDAANVLARHHMDDGLDTGITAAHARIAAALGHTLVLMPILMRGTTISQQDLHIEGETCV